MALAKGETSAMNNLGYLLFEGLGGPTDVEQALALWRRAAKLGHSEAQWHLGEAYERGKGVQPSFTEAYAWYRCAMASAQAAPSSDATETEIFKDAGKSLAKLLEKLAPEQFAAAELLAKQYVASYARRTGEQPITKRDVARQEAQRLEALRQEALKRAQVD
jgi:hypothetical protein